LLNYLGVNMKTIDKNAPVLVTGVTGYIASWIVKKLLEDGYTVHGTVRDLANNERIAHLLEFSQEAPEKLKLFQADLLHTGDFIAPMKGCQLVIHTASPFIIGKINDPYKQLIDPALKGTENVLFAADQTESVKRIVLTSSVASIFSDGIDLQDTVYKIFTEKQWNVTSSPSYQPYHYSKMVAEKRAWEIARNSGWDMVVVNPGFVMGPSLTKRNDSASIGFLSSLLNGKYKAGVPNISFGIVDVRDVAKAHISAGLRYESTGRHILVSATWSTRELIAYLKSLYGEKYMIPKKILPKWLLYLVGPFAGFSWKYVYRNVNRPLSFDNTRAINDLKIHFRPVKDTLKEHVEQLIDDKLI